MEEFHRFYVRVEAACQTFLRGMSEPFKNVVVKAEVVQMVIVEPCDSANGRSPTCADDAIELSEDALVRELAADEGQGAGLESDADNGHDSCDNDREQGA